MKTNIEAERQLKANLVGFRTTSDSSRGLLATVDPLHTAVDPEQMYLADWQNQIIQSSASYSDSEIALGYVAFLLALDTNSNQQLATNLYSIAQTPRDFEVMLYRITPEQRVEIWNRLSATRINDTIDYLQLDDRDVLAWYIKKLYQLGLAPDTSVPWNRIP